MSDGAVTVKDMERVIPFSRGTTELFKTGQWSARKPVYREKVSPCGEACPAGNDIPAFLSAVSEADFDAALRVLLEENPLPGICGRVCYHPCQSACNRLQFDEAVQIRALERAAADFGKALPHMRSADKPQKVLVVGAGPAGLSAAYFLRILGHEVTLVEQREEPGGVLRYGIPQYRLPKDTIDREVGRILSLGITLRTGVAVTRDTLASMGSQHDSVFLATGAWVARRTEAPGEEETGILFGLDFLVSPVRGLENRKRILVIGGGDVAVDVARVASRLAGPHATITMVAPERSGEFPAIAEGLREAKEEGVRMIGGYRPAEFSGNGSLKSVRFVRTKVVKGDAGEYRMLPARGKDLLLEADLAIVAIGQIPDSSVLPPGLVLNSGPHVQVDEFGMTPSERVYAGGDLVRQRPAVVDAIASGKRAALAIHLGSTGAPHREVIRALQIGGGRSISLSAFLRPDARDLKTAVRYEELNTLLYRKAPAHTGTFSGAAVRKAGFEEVARGLERETAVDEAKRCFYCGHCIGCDLCFLLCPDISIIKAKQGYTVKADYCKGCSMCASTCPRHVIEMGAPL